LVGVRREVRRVGMEVSEEGRAVRSRVRSVGWEESVPRRVRRRPDWSVMRELVVECRRRGEGVEWRTLVEDSFECELCDEGFGIGLGFEVCGCGRSHDR
jgi:hypothetical protein